MKKVCQLNNPFWIQSKQRYLNNFTSFIGAYTNLGPLKHRKDFPKTYQNMVLKGRTTHAIGHLPKKEPKMAGKKRLRLVVYRVNPEKQSKELNQKEKRADVPLTGL